MDAERGGGGDVTWADPPPVRPGRKAWVLTEKQRKALRRKPGVWALVRTARSRHVKRGDLLARHPDGFDFTIRTTAMPDGETYEVGIYARFGDSSARARLDGDDDE